ncbi:conjugal transfer protein TraM [Acinetobacter baumannii]|uniref:conjugal transfer protein TraM n=1 Tax=Acinetobacter baumannii TaxID=470 RepID=UPI0034E1FF08
MLDFDEIRKEVALKHNVLLGKDDPILVSVTLHEMVLERHIDLLSEHYATYTRELAAALQQHVDQSTEMAEKIINQATLHVTDKIKAAAQEAVAESYNKAAAQAASINDGIKQAIESQERYRDELLKARKVTFVATGVAIICALLAMYFGLK